jgi:hypothetical protein
MKYQESKAIKRPVFILGIICSIIFSMILIVPLQTIGMTSTDNTAIYGTITGIVTDTETDEPISNAVMTLTYHDMVRVDRTDTEGWYEFDNVPICFCLKNISAFKDGYEPRYQLVGVYELTYVNFTLIPINSTSPDPEEPEEPPEDEPPDDEDGFYGLIAGVVIDASTKEPIPGATVTLTCHDEIRTQYTDPNGEYMFDKVPICYCLKNVSIVTNGYENQYQMVAVNELTFVNFTLEPKNSEIDERVEDINSGASPGDINSIADVKDDGEDLNNLYLLLFFIGLFASLIIFGLIYHTIGKEVKTRKLD